MTTRKIPFVHSRVLLSFVLLYSLLSCSEKSTIDQFVIASKATIQSKILNENRRLWIHLPEGYDSCQIAYPVLYVLDAEWEDHYANAVAAAGHLSEFGHSPDLIVVGIMNTLRERDMLPVKMEGRPISGGSLQFLRFITDELMPYINADYRTKPFAILFGGSNAGLFTLYALLENPDSFNAYIAGSPMIGHCRDFIYEKTDKLLNENLQLNRFLFMIYGKYDFKEVTSYVPDYHRYVTARSPDNFACHAKMLEEEGHVPFISLHDGLRTVFSEWRFPEDARADATLTELKHHFSRISDRYGFESEIPLDLLIGLGYRSIEEGRTAEAVEALTLASGVYPYSPVAFYYLAEAYEKDNEIELALDNYRRALDVEPDYQMAAEKIRTLGKKD